MSERSFAVFVLVAARVVPVIAWLPAFAAHALPWSLRLGMGGALAAWFCFGFPTVSGSDSGWWPSAGGGAAPSFVRLAFLGFGELAIGVALAWLASLVFAAVEMAGRLVDVARRADGAALLAPLSGETGEDSTPMSALYVLLAVLVFAELGGPAHLVAALVRSYEVLPLAGNTAPQLQDRLLPLVARTMAGSVEVAVGLAAPVLIAVWLSDLVLALGARLLGRGPEMGLMVSTAAPLVGLAVVLLGLGILRAGMEGWLLQIPHLLLRTSQLWGRG